MEQPSPPSPDPLSSWGSIPQTFDIEYEGVDWEVVVRIK
jgi:hypothetical protein